MEIWICSSAALRPDFQYLRSFHASCVSSSFLVVFLLTERSCWFGLEENLQGLSVASISSSMNHVDLLSNLILVIFYMEICSQIFKSRDPPTVFEKFLSKLIVVTN